METVRLRQREREIIYMGFPGGSSGKESADNAGHPDSIPGLGRFPGEGNGYPENPMDRGAWWAISMGSQRVSDN